MAPWIPTSKSFASEDVCGDAATWSWRILLHDCTLPIMKQLMASVEKLIKNDCLEDWLQEILVIDRQEFKDISNRGHLYMNRRRHDLGNYKYSVLFQFMTRLAPHHGQEHITRKLMQLSDRYESLSKPSSTTDTGIEMRGDVIEYCLYFALMTGPSIQDDVREARLSFNRDMVEFNDAYDSLIHGLCMSPPVAAECPHPDWLAKTISLAVMAHTSISRGAYCRRELWKSVAMLSNGRQ